MGATVDWWYHLQEPGMVDNSVFGSLTRRRHCVSEECMHKLESPTNDWRMQRVDINEYEKALSLRMLPDVGGETTYFAGDLLQALRGCPNRDIGGCCSNCGGKVSSVCDTHLGDVMVMISESRCMHDGSR
jgi:hypothetical protein